MLVEMLSDYDIVMANTDGIELMVKHEDLSKVNTICREWEKKTNLILEDEQYSHLIIRDVNNYIAQTTSGSIKTKGCFEWDKKVGKEKAVWKDHSQLIVPKALKAYFIDGILPENFILQSNDIFDFCKSKKVGRQFKLKYHTLQSITPMSRIVRYYISTTGGALIKHKNDNTTTNMEVGQNVTIYNKHTDTFPDNINYDYYINECYKIIRPITNKQLTLF